MLRAPTMSNQDVGYRYFCLWKRKRVWSDPIPYCLLSALFGLGPILIVSYLLYLAYDPILIISSLPYLAYDPIPRCLLSALFVLRSNSMPYLAYDLIPCPIQAPSLSILPLYAPLSLVLLLGGLSR